MIREVEITLNASPTDENNNFIINELWTHNEIYAPVDMKPFLLTAVDNGKTVAGLVARTWWHVLDIQYLWVHESLRRQGIGKRMMLLAEKEAIKNNCHMATVDTFSCQSPDFYHKLGYLAYGTLDGYAGNHSRIYLKKSLL